MKIQVTRLGATVLAAALALITTPGLAVAHMPGQPHSMMEKNSGYVEADPALFRGLVLLGGGPTHFHGITFRQAMAGTPAREAALRQALGSDGLNRFDRVLTTAVTNRLRYLREQHAATVAVPARYRDPQSFADALYRIGTKHGAFSVEEVYNHIFGTEGHEQIMAMLSKQYSPLDDQAFHQVFQRIIFTRKSH